MAASHGRSWLESKGALIVVSVVASVVAGVRRWWIERSKLQGHQPMLRRPTDPRLRPDWQKKEAMDEWLAQHARRPAPQES